MDFDPLDFDARTAADNDRRQKAGNRVRVEKEDWVWVTSTKRGRRIVWRMLEQAGVFQTSFTGNSETFFKEGKRAFGLLILAAVMAAAPTAFTAIMQEATE